MDTAHQYSDAEAALSQKSSQFICIYSKIINKNYI